jgi:hypothetical protein
MRSVAIDRNFATMGRRCPDSSGVAAVVEAVEVIAGLRFVPFYRAARAVASVL